MTVAALAVRVSGVAAALGAGVVVSLAAAAPAAAEPDSAASPSSSSSARTRTSADAPSAPRRPAATAGPSRPAATAGPSRPSAAAVTRPISATRAVIPATVSRPAAAAPSLLTSPSAASKPVTTPELPNPTSFDPVADAAAALANRRESRRDMSSGNVIPAVTPAVTAGSTATPGPIARFLNGLFRCDPRGRQITIYKGTHFAIPNNFGGFFVQRVTGTGTLTSDSVYDLKDEDQHDWSKFTGIAFTPLEPDRNSVMVGWRYDLITQEFEIAPFYNVDKVRVLPVPADIISVPAGETFDYLVDYTGVTLSYGGKTVFKPYPQGLTPNVWTAVRVSGWFGGNEVAPRTLSYFIKFT